MSKKKKNIPVVVEEKPEGSFARFWNRLSDFSHFMIIGLAVLMVVQTILTALMRAGLVLKWTGATYLLNGILILALLLWAGGVIYLRRREKKGKATITLILVVLVLMLSSSLMLGFYGVITTYIVPKHEADIVAKDGRTYSLMSVMIMAQEPADILRETVNAELGTDYAAPETEMEEDETFEYGKSYYIYPKKAFVFVDTRVPLTGGLFKRNSSTAEILQETLDTDGDGTYDMLHIFLSEPCDGDFGELFLPIGE